MPVTQQTVLITGANRGLGLGLARAFLADGNRVIAVNRTSSPELEQAGEENLEVFLCDLTNDERLKALADELKDRTIDVLINNAGMMAKPSFVAGESSVQGFGYFNHLG